MGSVDFFYQDASGVGAAVSRKKVCGLLDGDRSAGKEFSGDGFLVDTRGLAYQLFDGGGGVNRRGGVVERKEKDNAETQSAQSRRRDGRQQ